VIKTASVITNSAFPDWKFSRFLVREGRPGKQPRDARYSEFIRHRQELYLFIHRNSCKIRKMTRKIGEIQMNTKQNKPIPANWRLTTLANLAAARANLLRQFRGLDANSFNNIVSGAWTAKDMLPHIAYWDAFHADCLAKVLHNASQSIRINANSQQLTDENEQVRLRHQSTPLEQAWAMGLKERGGFLATIGRLTDAELFTQIVLSDGRTIYPYEWVERHVAHDAAHAAELAAWRDTLPAEATQQNSPKFIIRTLLKATRKEFLTIAMLVAVAERESKPVCGVWTLKDVVGHLLDWELVGVDALRQLATWQMPEFAPIPDFDVFNTSHAADRHEQSWSEIWAAFTATRQELLAIFDGLSDEELKRPFSTPWNSTINGYNWTLIWSGHEHEHAADVRTAVFQYR
jgi:hypothetical protein